MADPTESKDVPSNERDQGLATKDDPDTCENVQTDEEVVIQQPKKSNGAPNDDKKSSFKKKTPSGKIKIDPFNENACVKASAGVGSMSKDYCDGAANAEYVGPNVSCVMSCAEFPTIVTDCTFEICSANYLFGVILCTLGLAFNTKVTWTVEGVQAELLGTGVDTSEGFAIGAFGSKIGLGNAEKRKKKWAKKKLKWRKKVGPEPEEEEDEEVNGEVNDEADDGDGDDDGDE